MRIRSFVVVLTTLALLVIEPLSGSQADPGGPSAGDQAIVSTTAGEMTVITSVGKFSQVGLVPAPADAPLTHEYPVGFLGVGIKQVPKGGETTLTLQLPAGIHADAAMKCVPGSGCAPFPATAANRSIALVLRDGGAGDADGKANGRILDPVAPAVLRQDSTCPLPTGTEVLHEWEGTVGLSVAGADDGATDVETFDVPAGCAITSLTVVITWDLRGGSRPGGCGP